MKTWTYSKIEGKPLFNIREGQQSIAHVFQNVGSNVLNDREGDGEKHAKLIAAAPEMLEALQKLKTGLENEKENGLWEADFIISQILDPIIHKATH